MLPVKKGLLILVRHGLSEWNQLNVFTGWFDPPIIQEGREGARVAGKLLKDAGCEITAYFESDLIRAQQTLDGMLEGMGLRRRNLSITRAWEIKERDYGELGKKNKDEVRQQFGEEQFLKWRRSYDVAPPKGESLKDTCDRVLPYFRKYILSRAQKEENVLVSAHGNSIRAMIMELDHLSGDEIVKVEIPWTTPIIYAINAKGEATERFVLGYHEAIQAKFPYFATRYQAF